LVLLAWTQDKSGDATDAKSAHNPHRGDFKEWLLESAEKAGQAETLEELFTQY
jgi:hypothetical protein